MENLIKNVNLMVENDAKEQVIKEEAIQILEAGYNEEKED
jgi:hypothetical protein